MHPSAIRPPRPIVLVGMPGAGKTTVGRLLAARLGVPFHDVDELVEAELGASIGDIFAARGESAFRTAERKVIARLLTPLVTPDLIRGPPSFPDEGTWIPDQVRHDGDFPCVIALGGGGFTDPPTRALILERATAVWLQADLATLVQRLHGTTTRPLLSGNLEMRLAQLLAERSAPYAEAPIHLLCDDVTPGQVAAEILCRLKAEPSDPIPRSS